MNEWMFNHPAALYGLMFTCCVAFGGFIYRVVEPIALPEEPPMTWQEIVIYSLVNVAGFAWLDWMLGY